MPPPAAVRMFEIMHGEKYGSELKAILFFAIVGASSVHVWPFKQKSPAITRVSVVLMNKNEISLV